MNLYLHTSNERFWEGGIGRGEMMGSVGTSNHLEFEKLPLEKEKKLHKYKVINHSLYQDIGIIHWRGGWRKYVFQALPKTDMDKGCHKQIDDFIDELMKKWRQGLKRSGR